MTLLDLLINALAAVAVVCMRVLPAWYYNLAITKRKPLNCETCFAFWLTCATCLAGGETLYLVPVYGLAASALTRVIWAVVA